MKKYSLMILTTLFLAGSFIIGIPEGTVTAQTLETAPNIPSIVSCSGVISSGTLPACNWCTFVQMIGNIIQYSIYLAVILSSLMFAYAGFLFMTNNGKAANITKAWEIFRRTIYGIIAILAAWLIINAIMTKIAGPDIGADWNKITDCQDFQADPNKTNPEYTRYINDKEGGYNDLVSTTSTYEQQVAQWEDGLLNTRENAIGGSTEPARPASGVVTERLTVVSSYSKPACTENKPECVYMDGLNENTVKVVEDLQGACAGCNITISAAAEPGHEDSEQNDVYTHVNGYKVGIKATIGMNNFLTTKLTKLEDESTRRVSVYKDKCGNRWVYNSITPQYGDFPEWTATIKSSTQYSSSATCFQ